jgi:alpha-L-fucosidase 2
MKILFIAVFSVIFLFQDVKPKNRRFPANCNCGYEQPAEKWTEALPVGNGRLGAMIFGGPETEQVQ